MKCNERKRYISVRGDKMNQLKWLSQQMGKQKKWFFLAMGLAAMSSALYIVFPFITKQITDMFLSGEVLTDETLQGLLKKLPLMLAILVVAQLLRSIERYGMLQILENVSQSVQEAVRIHIYENLSRQDDKFYHTHRTGDLMTRLTGDLDLVRHMISWVSFSVVESITMFVFSIIYFFSINVKLTLALLAITPALLICSYIYTKSVYPFYVNLRERLSHMNSVAQENIAGNKTVRAFAREKVECEKFDVCNDEYKDANITTNFHWLKFFPVIEAFSQVLTLLTILLGGFFIINGEMTLGGLAAFSLLSWGISEPMRSLGVYINDFQRFLTSATKVIEVYYAQPIIKNPLNGAQSASEYGTICFDKVTCKYNYGKTIALKDVSFQIKAGQTLAVLGPTGSGKTTLVNLIARLLDPTDGTVYVDGISTKKWDLFQLRKRVSFATQKVLLHSDSVHANIAYSNQDMPAEKVKQYASLAAATFIDELPQGYETIVGEQGVGLSGGQKQRIALARALAKEPEILVLDDTTSAVDNETEKALRENLRNLPYECTKIVIAQRISAVRDADLILVLQHGEITQQGTHEMLCNEEGYYREICEMQGVATQEASV